MTNREHYILNANEYDMLIRIQACMVGCVLEALTGKDYPCPDDSCALETCKKCIQQWLNQQYDGKLLKTLLKDC